MAVAGLCYLVFSAKAPSKHVARGSRGIGEILHVEVRVEYGKEFRMEMTLGLDSGWVSRSSGIENPGNGMVGGAGQWIWIVAWVLEDYDGLTIG